MLPLARLLLIGACVFSRTVVQCQTGTPSEQYARAEALIREHQWDAGMVLLRSVLTDIPANVKALNLMGLAFAGKGDPRQAEAFFQSALKVAPNFTPALKNLAIEEIALGETQTAQQHLQAAFEQSPDDPIVNLYLGEISYRQNAFPAAAEHFRHAKPLAARDPNVLARLAISELKAGERNNGLETTSLLRPETLEKQWVAVLGVELAKEDLCHRAIPFLVIARAVPTASTDIGYDLAVCYLSVKQHTEAATQLQLLIDQGHESSEIDNILAEVDEADHKTQQAVDALRRAIALSPSDDENYLDFASLCLDHQDFENAEKVLSVGLTVHPKSSRLIFERGILNAMRDRFEDAERDFQLSADLTPGSDTGYIGLGVTYLETGKAAQAVPVLRSRLQDHPEDANLDYLLAEALLRSGVQQGQKGYTEAEMRLEESTRLNPNMVEPHVSLGTIYLRQDKVREAAAQFEWARKIDPASKSACAHLAVAYRKLGKADKAQEVLNALKQINDRERAGQRELVRTPDHTSDAKTYPAP